MGTKASNSEQGVGVSVGAYTEEVDSISRHESGASVSQLTPKPRHKKINAKDEYYKLKIEREKQKATKENEFLEIEKQKLELLKKLIDKL